MYTSIVSKFNMWQTIFPCFQVLFNDSTQQRRQSSIYYFSLTIRLWKTTTWFPTFPTKFSKSNSKTLHPYQKQWS
jgi:hypothetical protein